MHPKGRGTPKSKAYSLTLSTVNPFAKREEHNAQTIVTYKIFTILTWLLSVVSSVYYTIDPPRDGVYLRNTIWDQNGLYPTGFTLNQYVVDVYW
jgi:hypothetical protein